jgi:hypothetical protein
MTLIYGVATAEIGFLVGDTLVSFEREYGNRKFMGQTGPVNGEAHVLKIHILDPDTAIGFTTNDVPRTLATINTVQQQLRADPNLDVCRQLFDHIATGTEFLVLRLSGGSKSLGHVTNAGIAYRERAYIGDPEAHSEVSKLRRPRSSPETRTILKADGSVAGIVPVTAAEREFDEISDAMEEFTHRRDSPTVGAIIGCVLRVVDARLSGKLEYMQAIEAGISPWEGITGYTLLPSNTGGVRGIGLYFRGGQFGFIFVAGDTALCHKEYAPTVADFIELAHSKYGLRLEGGTWSEAAA